MGLLDNIIKRFSYDYCKECKRDMEVIKLKIYSLPLNCSCKLDFGTKFEVFETKAELINEISEIPTGFLGAYAKIYRCDNCFKQKEAFEIFLPVRGQIVPKLNIEVEEGKLNKLKDFKET